MHLDSLDQLRARIKQIEGRKNTLKNTMEAVSKDENHSLESETSAPLWSFGTPEIDQFFTTGLSPEALHEITPAGYQDSWAALSFALALLSCRARHDQRPVLWCSSAASISEYGGLYGQGLQRFNLNPARFILIETKNDQEAGFVLEEALKSAQLCAVIGQLDALDLTPSRRLSLMAKEGETPALLVTKPGQAGIKTALTRWQVASLSPVPSLTTPFSFHQPGWQIALTRNRQGPADKKWHLEFPSYEPPLNTCSKKAFRFAHPSPFRNRKSRSAA